MTVFPARDGPSADPPYAPPGGDHDHGFAPVTTRPVFRLAVLASGSGTNLQAIIDQLHRLPATGAGSVAAAGRAAVGATVSAPGQAAASQPLSAAPSEESAAPSEAPGGDVVIEVALVVSDVPGARALERAHAAGIPTAVFPPADYATREDHDLAMAEAIRTAGADLIVLAGYMRLVSPALVRAFPSLIINLHPALLPAFPGTTSIGDAVEYGVKVTGVTVHFVDEGVDTGPVIAQEPVRVTDVDTAESLAARIHAVEHQLLPAAIRLIATGRVRPPLPGTRVVQVDWSEGSGADRDAMM